MSVQVPARPPSCPRLRAPQDDRQRRGQQPHAARVPGGGGAEFSRRGTPPGGLAAPTPAAPSAARDLLPHAAEAARPELPREGKGSARSQPSCRGARTATWAAGTARLAQAPGARRPTHSSGQLCAAAAVAVTSRRLHGPRTRQEVI